MEAFLFALNSFYLYTFRDGGEMIVLSLERKSFFFFFFFVIDNSQIVPDHRLSWLTI